MITTRFSISEQIIEFLKGSPQFNASIVDQPAVQQAVNQVVNKLLRIEHFDILNFKEEFGDLTPSGLVIATYTNVAITSYATNYSKLTLPATPIRLPKDIGCFHIGPDPFNSWIPVPPGLFQMVGSEPLISDLLGQVAYERHGLDVIFTDDLTAGSPAITSAAFVKLVVMDISTLSDYEPLPIPADMEIDVIREVLKLFGVQPPADNKVDPVSENR